MNLTKNQSVCMTALFLLGSSAVFGLNLNGGRDAWVSLLLAGAVCVPVFLMYARIISLFPEYSFYELIRKLTGKILGTVITVLFVWFAMHSAALLLRIIHEFVILNALPQPPYLIFPAIFLLTSIYMVRKGIATLGKWSAAALIITLVILGISVFSSIRFMDPRFILPVLRRPAGDILRGSARTLAFPLLEGVVLLPLLTKKSGTERPYRTLLLGLAAAVVILLAVLLQSLFLIGETNMISTFFPSVTAARVVSIGSFLTRVEEGLSVYIILTSLTKMSVCLHSAAMGAANMLNLREPGVIAVPIGLFIFALSFFSADNLLDLTSFISSFPLYSAVFQLGIPALLWITAEVRHRRGRLIPAESGAV